MFLLRHGEPPAATVFKVRNVMLCPNKQQQTPAFSSEVTAGRPTWVPSPWVSGVWELPVVLDAVAVMDAGVHPQDREQVRMSELGFGDGSDFVILFSALLSPSPPSPSSSLKAK